MSLAVMAMIVGAISAAMVIAAKSTPGGDADSEAITQAAEALDRMTLDLSYALTITRLDTSEIAVTISDRDGNAASDTVSYAWSGTPGDPLIRTYNGVSSPCVMRVYSLTIEANTDSVTQRFTRLGITMDAGTTRRATVRSAVTLVNAPEA